MTATTVKQMLDRAEAVLARARIDQGSLKSQLVMSHVLGCRRLELPLRFGDAMDDRVADAVAYYVDEVAGGIPIQYALGEVEFMGLRFGIDGRALIPRPETEALVAAILGDPDVWRGPDPNVIDVGTGSGCIVLALAQFRPGAAYTATDMRHDALTLARENARRLGLEPNVRFVQGDLLDPLGGERFDLIVSNPPYIATGDIEMLDAEVRAFEPRWALDGGPHGVSIMERLVPQAFTALRSRGKIYMEIGKNQANCVCNLMRHAGFASVEVTKDLAGRDRIALGVRP